MDELEENFSQWRSILKEHTNDVYILGLFETVFAYIKSKELKLQFIKLAIESFSKSEITSSQLNKLVNYDHQINIRRIP